MSPALCSSVSVASYYLALARAILQLCDTSPMVMPDWLEDCTEAAVAVALLLVELITAATAILVDVCCWELLCCTTLPLTLNTFWHCATTLLLPLTEGPPMVTLPPVAVCVWAKAGAAATSIIASIAAKTINFLILLLPPFAPSSRRFVFHPLSILCY